MRNLIAIKNKEGENSWLKMYYFLSKSIILNILTHQASL